MERRVHKVRKAIGTTGDADEDWRIISQLAKRMGSSSFNFSSDLEVFEELQATVEQYNGLDINQIEKFGQIWEYSEPDKYSFQPLTLESIDATHHDPQFPMSFVPGRVLHEPDREADISIIDNMHSISRTEIIELNEQDAQSAGISEGDKIKLIGEDFEKEGTAHLNGLHSGLVASTSLFGSLMEQLTASKDEDPMLKVQPLQVKHVRVEKE